MAVGCFAVAVVPTAWAAGETVRRGPPLPASVQRQLPTEISLGNLCRRDITVRELAEEQLKDMESNGPDCDPDLERRLRSAM